MLSADCDSCLDEHPPVVIDTSNPYRRPPIAVKMSEAARLAPPVPRHPLQLTYADDVRMAKGDCMAAILSCRRAIEAYEATDPENAQTRAERDYGAGTTVEQAIEKNRTVLDRCEQELLELRRAPTEREEDLFASLVVRQTEVAREAPFHRARCRFHREYGHWHSTKTRWLISRSAVVADSYLPDQVDEGAGGWGSDGVWRASHVNPQILRVVADDVAALERAIDYPMPRGLDQLIGQRLDLVRRAALIVATRDRQGDEDRRAKWQRYMDMEISTLAQTTGVDYEIEIDGSLPDDKTVDRFEEELVVVEAEDEAQLRDWESVNAVNEKIYVVDDEEQAWAKSLEEEAEETRQWARYRRQGFSEGGHVHVPLTKVQAESPQLPRSRARSSRKGRTLRRRARRAASRSPGGGSDDPDPEPPGRSSPPRQRFPDRRLADLPASAGGRR